MAGLIASGIVKWTANKISSLLSAPIVSSSSGEGVAALEDLQELRRTMTRIQRTLDESSEHTIRGETDRLRLRELQQFVYDAQDAVDEYKFEQLRRRMEDEDRRRGDDSSRSGRKRKGDKKEPEPDPIPVRVSDELATRVKKILERFNEITRAWNDLQMDENDGLILEDDEEMLPLPSNPYADEVNVVGREEDKENLIKLVTAGDNADGENLSVLSIVGMGGLGKTTLAQLVYNDQRVSKYFELKGWVHVSPDSTVHNLASKILVSLTKRQFEAAEMDDLQDELMEKVRGTKFLLVLDDVWNDNKDLWSPFLTPMLSARLGMILLTTRSESVSRTFQTMPPYHLSFLSADKSWILFRQLAFGSDIQNIHGDFEAIGKKITEKCGGLPLAIKAIASALRFEPMEETWKEILNSELWELPGSEDSVLPSLRLSYDQMPKHLKRCFMFLALLPKGYLFLKDNVINLWMSMDALKQGGRKRLENIGNLYFDDLVQRTMMQLTNSDDELKCFIVHDLVHDLLQFVAGEDFLKIDIQHFDGLAQSYRYLSLIVSSSDTNVELHSAHIPVGLRIFQLINATDNSHCHSKLFSFNINVSIAAPLWESFRQLRVLDFSHTGLKTLPDSIGELKLLRYLSLFKTQITKLPESICELYYLKVLDARTYSLAEVPEGIDKLVSLRHLKLEHLSPLCMPIGVGHMTKLQSLSRFSIGSGSWHCNIAELHGLVNIRGELFITGLRRVSNVDDAQTANLVSKQHLQQLTLEWADGSIPGKCSHHPANRNDIVVIPELEEAVFESLRPHTNLKELEVANYGGYRYPSWLGHSSFSQLIVITMHGLSCEFLPPLGQLPRLLELSVQWMRCVKHVRKEFCGQGCTRGFPGLKILEFENMTTWVEWSEVAEGDFPCLHDLRIKESIELRYLPQPLSSSLSRLVISRCDKLLMLPALPNLSSLILKGNINEELFSDLNLPLLKAMKVSISHNIESIMFNRNLPLLEFLVIRACRRLQAIAGLSNLVSLKLLNIVGCQKLMLPFDQPLPQQLARLTISKCPQLQEWLEFQNAELYDQMQQSNYAREEDQEALEVLWDDTEDEIEDEFLDIGEGECDDGDESDSEQLDFSIDDDDR